MHVLFWNLHLRGERGRKGRECKFKNKAHKTLTQEIPCIKQCNGSKSITLVRLTGTFWPKIFRMSFSGWLAIIPMTGNELVGIDQCPWVIGRDGRWRWWVGSFSIFIPSLSSGVASLVCLLSQAAQQQQLAVRWGWTVIHHRDLPSLLISDRRIFHRPESWSFETDLDYELFNLWPVVKLCNRSYISSQNVLLRTWPQGMFAAWPCHVGVLCLLRSKQSWCLFLTLMWSWVRMSKCHNCFNIQLCRRPVKSKLARRRAILHLINLPECTIMNRKVLVLFFELGWECWDWLTFGHEPVNIFAVSLS